MVGVSQSAARFPALGYFCGQARLVKLDCFSVLARFPTEGFLNRVATSQNLLAHSNADAQVVRGHMDK